MEINYFVIIGQTFSRHLEAGVPDLRECLRSMKIFWCFTMQNQQFSINRWNPKHFIGLRWKQFVLTCKTQEYHEINRVCFKLNHASILISHDLDEVPVSVGLTCTCAYVVCSGMSKFKESSPQHCCHLSMVACQAQKHVLVRVVYPAAAG